MVHSQHNSMRVFQWYVIELLLPGTRTPAPRLMQEQADREVNRVLEYCLVFSACFGCYGAWWRCSLGSSVPSRLHGVPLRLLRCLILPLLHSFYCYIAQCDAPSAAASLGVVLRLLRRLVCSFGGSSRSLPRLFGRFGVRLPVAACCARCARQAAWSLGVVRRKRWSLRNAQDLAGPVTPRVVVGTAV